jgi:hypothetical protein
MDDMRHTGQTAIYEIQIQGHITLDWSSWMSSVTATHDDDGTTFILGEVQDQAALHGALVRIRDTGLVILSVTRLPKSRSEQ